MITRKAVMVQPGTENEGGFILMDEGQDFDSLIRDFKDQYHPDPVTGDGWQHLTTFMKEHGVKVMDQDGKWQGNG